MKFIDIEGKTIKRATHLKLKKYDDENYLRLDFTDGAHCYIVGGYGGYTGNSEDEYIQLISMEDDTDCRKLTKVVE